MPVARKPFLLGNDQLDFTYTGADASLPLTGVVSLDGTHLADLYAHAAGDSFTFYDVQALLPEFKLAMPEFTDFTMPMVDALRQLCIEYKQGDSFYDKSIHQVLLAGGRSPHITKGRNYTERKPIPFLTNQPQAKETTMNSTEWLFLPMCFDYYTPLYWESLQLPLGMPTQLRLRATAVDAAGATTVVALHSETEHSNNTLQGFDVSPYRIMPLLPEGTVGYFFQVFDEADAAVSEKRYFHLVPAREDDLHLVFRNSLGCWDTMSFRGYQVRTLQAEQSRQQYRRAVSVADITGYQKLNVKLTQLDSHWQMYLQELLFSTQIFLHENTMQELVIETQTLPYLDTGKYTENVELDFRFATTSPSF